MSEAVAALEARLTAIEARPLDEGASAAALAAYGREVAALRELVAEQADTAAALKEKADHSAQVALARTAVTRIVAALDSGAPYRAAIVDLTSVTGGSVAPVLDSHADEGIVTLAALIESYPDAARAALAQARADKVDAGTGNKLGNFLKTQFGARSVEAREGSDTDAILSRAEAALKAGDLDAALAELDTLAEGPKSVMSEWAAQAQTRRDVAQAAEDLAQTLNNN
nr:mitofilin family membrane protein [Shimia sp. R11_0]